MTPWGGRARQVHASGTLQMWWDKLGKVFAEAWGEVVVPAGRTGSSTPFQGLFLPNGAMKPHVLPPLNECVWDNL